MSTAQGNASKKVEIVVLETSASYCPAERIANNRGDFRFGVLCCPRDPNTIPDPTAQTSPAPTFEITGDQGLPICLKMENTLLLSFSSKSCCCI